MTNRQMLEWITQELKEAAGNLTLENLTVQRGLIEKHLDVLKALEELFGYQQYHAFGDKKDNIETMEENSREESGKSNCPTYLFERKLKGGFVSGIDGYVPEKIIRTMGLVHGDRVYATPLDLRDPHAKRFKYKIAKKGEGKDNPDRIQFNFCPVIKKAGRLVVEKSEETGESIRYDESQYTVVLNEDDVFEHKLTKGSLVDIAYPKDKPQLARVIWTHYVEENELPSRKPSSVHKKEARHTSPVEQTLSGKTILVIGNEPKKALYKMAVEQRGGEMIWADAKDQHKRLEACVRKSDLVIFLLAVSGHVGMEHIKQMCKEHHVPFETTWSKGYSTIIRLAEKSEEKIVQ